MICRPLRHSLSFHVWPPPGGRSPRGRAPSSGLLWRRIARATAALFLLSLFLPFFLHDSQQSDKEHLKRLCFRYAATGCYEVPKQFPVSDWRMSGHDDGSIPRRERGGGFQSIPQLFLLFWMRAVCPGKKTRRILLI